MRRTFLTLLAIGFAGAAFAAPRPLLASSWVELGEARLRLIMETPEDGDIELRAGLEIQLAGNFKTYWRNPGDSGVPPLADFSGSTGLRDSRIEFPFPTRFDDGAGGTAFGYKKSVILPISAIREKNSTPKLHLKLDFAVCGTMCIPLSATLELAPGAASAPLDHPGFLESARQQVPIKLDATRADAQITLHRLADGDKPRWRIILSPGLEAASAAIFLEANGYLSSGTAALVPENRLGFEITGEASPGTGGKFGPTRLTFGDAKHAFETMIDLDGAPQAP